EPRKIRGLCIGPPEPPLSRKQSRLKCPRAKNERRRLLLAASSHPYSAVLAVTPERRKISRSALIVSAFVVGMPCGKLLWVFSVPFFNSLADNREESA